MPPSSDPTPETLFAIWLARRQAGDDVDIESLCRAHPEAAIGLRGLHGDYQQLEQLRRRFGLAGSLAERLGTRYGSQVDPRVELEREADADSDFASALLGRLSDRERTTARYRAKEEVARGGMGAILRVWDEDLRRHLAMKVMLGKAVAPTAASEEPGVEPRTLARFLEEAQITGQLDHPGIVPVHELGLDAGGHVYFTMKLVRGQTLKQVFDQLARGEGGWTRTRVLGGILRVCEAMSYAHAKGVIHRDLKPANVMVGRFGEVYVMDWGLAKILDREDAKDLRVAGEGRGPASMILSERSERAGETPDSPLVTMDGDVLGTPAYMSPEQAQSRVGEMGPHSDVYAVGAMLYHLLAGQMPYVPPGTASSNYTVWKRVQEGPPASLHELAPRTPAELVAICEKAMARETHQRYADMSALAEDLSAYVEGRVVHAYETGAWAEARKWVRRNRPLAVALLAGLVLLVIGLVGTAALYRSAEQERASAVLERERADANAREAQVHLLQAQRSEREAEVQRDLARAQTTKVLRLSDAKRLQELVGTAERLWPPHPERIPELEAWLDAARALTTSRAEHHASLLEMRAGAQPWDSAQRLHDRRSHPRAGELARKRAELEGLFARLEQGLSGETLVQAERTAADLEAELEALAVEVESRRSWRFQRAEDQWQHDLLAELVSGLEALEAHLQAEDEVVPGIGWSVPERLAFARELEAGFGGGGEHARAWAAALPALREAYPGLDLAPQMGLVPLGPDPASALWEFAHLMTGAPAQRGADGELSLLVENGVVLVLLPGGRFHMGAQSSDPSGPNHDPYAEAAEDPVHAVEVGAFFLSKYELTQGQWLRMTGRNPSYYQLDRLSPSLLHPVEQVSWEDCMRWLPRVGLALPSEARWEYAARAGTDTPWWTGSERESLRELHAVNLADQAAARIDAPWQDIEDWPGLDDGHGVHAPIGTFAANPFGLHEVTGNLWEWCLDGYHESSYASSAEVEPLVPPEAYRSMVCRGGGFDDTAANARSATRRGNSPDNRYNALGVRPARAIER